MRSDRGATISQHSSMLISPSKHLFTDAPQPRCRLAVNCVRPDAGSSRPRFGRNASLALRMLQLRNVAILAVDASQTREPWAGRAPDLRRRTLFDGLETLGEIDDRGAIVADRSETFQGIVRQMFGQPGFENTSGMAAKARMPSFSPRRSSSTANKMLAVLDCP